MRDFWGWGERGGEEGRMQGGWVALIECPSRGGEAGRLEQIGGILRWAGDEPGGKYSLCRLYSESRP